MFGLHVAHSSAGFMECAKGGFQQHTTQQSSSISRKAILEEFPHSTVSAFYLDNLSPGNIKNTSSMKSSDICFKGSFLFSLFFSMKTRVHLIVWGRDVSYLDLNNRNMWRRWGRDGRCTQPGWGSGKLPSSSSSSSSCEHLHTSCHCILTITLSSGHYYFLILRKLNHRESEHLVQSHTAGYRKCLNPGIPAPLLLHSTQHQLTVS